jgi:hypothetical protein
MHKTKILLFSLLLISTQAFASVGTNPFNRSVKTTIGTNVAWQYKNDTAVKTAQDSLDSDIYYHLMFDGKSLHLRLSGGRADTSENVRHFEHFSVNDVKIDGRRIPLFQWCLDHQEQQSGFLQQGLAVEKNLCENRGENGLFTMVLNQNTINALKNGKTLSFVIKPFRTTNIVNFSLADFSSMVARVAPEQKAAQPAVKASASTAASICTVKPPAGFETIKPVQYPCHSVADESHANKSMAEQVSQIRKRREIENEKKRKAELEKKKKEEEARQKLELQQKQEAAAIAASKLKQQELSKEITGKMLAMCKSAWSRGENRCYCEKYIDQAPANIKAMPNPCK